MTAVDTTPDTSVETSTTYAQEAYRAHAESSAVPTDDAPVGWNPDREPETDPNALGVIYLPKSGTSVGSFQFLVATTAETVQIDTPVAADTPEGVVIGVVTDMTTVGSMADPFAAVYESVRRLGDPVAEAASSVKLATVQVYHSPALRPVAGGVVRSATPAEMELATGTNRMEACVPAGVVELVDGSFARINLDLHTLCGPESAHLAVAGLSGQASKTSFAGVLLRSAMVSSSRAGESISAIVFNVKGEDLVNLHLPPAAGYELTEDDHAIYEAMGIPAAPFEDVVVYAPSLPGGGGTRSSREDAELLQWDLRTIWRYLKYFSPGLYSNDNMMAFLGDVESAKINTENPTERLRTFDQLSAWMDSEVANAEAEQRSTIWRDHHIATARRARKLIMSLPGRCGGLLTKGQASPDNDVPIESMVDGRVVVVDIAGLEPLVQSAVIARTCERLLHAAEQNSIGVDHVVLFADELNMFAPANGGDMEAVRKVLTRISATGRYAGVSLWGAAQFISQVSPQIVGNAATRAAGILPDSEVDAGVFGRVLPGQRERLVTLPKGYMALKAHNLRGMLTVRFPRPAWQTGKPKGAKVRPGDAASSLGLSAKAAAKLTAGIDEDVVATVLADADGDREAAVKKLDRMREPDMSKVSVEKSSTFPTDDPWSID